MTQAKLIHKNRKFLFLLSFICAGQILFSQFAPPAGQIGTTAIYKDSSAFVNWGSACTVARGYQDISDISSGFASVGDSSMALGVAGSNGVVSLGDGGSAIIQFPFPIIDGQGFDFAVFENSFSDDYLELAFVEVSSDGINFFRFPATSNTQDSVQTGPFGATDATKINNLAGKYLMYYGTPFDLSELSGINGLNINHITHVKIVDVVGSIQPAYASTDINAHKINDPWPTAFASSGFDLDAVGVIHQNNSIGISEPNSAVEKFNSFYSSEEIHLQFSSEEKQILKIIFSDIEGRKILNKEIIANAGEFYNFSFDSCEIRTGIYFLTLYSSLGSSFTKKIIVP